MARPGLRLSMAVMDELDEAHEAAEGRKDLDMAERIQGLLPVSEGMAERRSPQIVGVGLGVLQSWVLGYRRGGREALANGRRPDRKPKLTEVPLAELDGIIEERPEIVGLETGLGPRLLTDGGRKDTRRISG